MKKILPLLTLSIFICLSFGLTTQTYSADTDRDAINDSIDICLGTPRWEIVDESGNGTWCSPDQKLVDLDADGTPNYIDTDKDGDGLTDTQEESGWIVRIPILISGGVEDEDYVLVPVTSNILLSDSDSDDLNDQEEKNKGTHPAEDDTDKDGISDDLDSEITSIEGRLYVDSNGAYDSSTYDSIDSDNDSVLNSDDLCPGTASGATIYTSGGSKWCTTTQKIQLLRDSDFDGVNNTDDTCPGTPYINAAYISSDGCIQKDTLKDSFVINNYRPASVSSYVIGNYTSAPAPAFVMYNYSSSANNISIWWSAGTQSSKATANDKLGGFNENNQFIGINVGGEKGLFNTLIRIARDIKNLFYAIATIFFIIISLKLILATNTEEEVGKFKKWIIWITIGLIVMQIALAFSKMLFDQWVSAGLGARLIENLIWPLILLLQTLAAIFFIAMAIFAFYRLVTANGNEEAVKSGKMTILYALIGFMIIRFARAIVEAFYGTINTCTSLGYTIVDDEAICNRVDVSGWSAIIIHVLNWLNGFVAIVVLIMIMFAGVQIILSNGDEEAIKKWKQSIIYIAIGLLILVFNYLILTFFLVPESTIVPIVKLTHYLIA